MVSRDRFPPAMPSNCLAALTAPLSTVYATISMKVLPWSAVIAPWRPAFCPTEPAGVMRGPAPAVVLGEPVPARAAQARVLPATSARFRMVIAAN